MDHPCKLMALSVLRSCGGAFKGGSMISWRPFLVVVLGLLGDSAASVEALDPRYMKKCWAMAAQIAASKLAALERQEQRLSQTDEEAAGATQEKPESSQESSVSSSSSSSSSSIASSSSMQDAAGHADSQTSAPAESVTPPGACSSPAPSNGKANGGPAASSFERDDGEVFPAPAASASTHQEQSFFDLDTAAVRRHLSQREIGRILASRRSSPLQILGVSRRASGVERRKAYRKLALLIHPDKCDHPDAAIAFHVLQDAYDKAC